MKQYRGYVFRIYPNVIQKELINKSLGVSRFIYNYFLDFKKKEYEENKNKYNGYDLIKMIPELNEKYPFLKEVDSCLLRCSIFELEDAFKGFFNGKGYPKFIDKYASWNHDVFNRGTGWYWDDLWPWIYAKFHNKKWKEFYKDYDGYLLIDFI